MRGNTQVSSEVKATTSPEQSAQAVRHLVTIRIVGTALFEYQVHKTTDARIRLESLATLAQAQGDLTDVEALVVAQVLANHNNSIQQLQGRNHV
ncbi:hypothetical protein D3C87_1719810 [compost metagenome]